MLKLICIEQLCIQLKHIHSSVGRLQKEKFATVQKECLRSCRLFRLHHARNKVIRKQTIVKESIDGTDEQRKIIWHRQIQRKGTRDKGARKTEKRQKGKTRRTRSR